MCFPFSVSKLAKVISHYRRCSAPKSKESNVFGVWSVDPKSEKEEGRDETRGTDSVEKIKTQTLKVYRYSNYGAQGRDIYINAQYQHGFMHRM